MINDYFGGRFFMFFWIDDLMVVFPVAAAAVLLRYDA